MKNYQPKNTEYSMTIEFWIECEEWDGDMAAV